MQILDARAVAAALPYAPLVEALREAFRGEARVPERQCYSLDGPGSPSLLLMPAWGVSHDALRGPVLPIVVKVVAVFPRNGERGLPAVMASVLVMSGDTGLPLALLDGGELTARRTAAASALAAGYLARPDAATLLVVGTGRMARHLAAAHRSTRPIRTILVWGRRRGEAERMAEELEGMGEPGGPPGAGGSGSTAAQPDGKPRSDLEIEVVGDLAAAVPRADIVSTATLAREPLIQGEWLRPGTHLDLVGAFTPGMREVDARAVARARVWVDTLEGARAEAGDLLHAAEAGVFRWEEVRGTLAGLCRGAEGRTHPDEITLFKSVGTALEDLAAARLALASSR